MLTGGFRNANSWPKDLSFFYLGNAAIEIIFYAGGGAESWKLQKKIQV